MAAARLQTIQRAAGSTAAVLGLDRSFALPIAHGELLKAKPAEYQLQVHCLQLNDSVTNRFHWPLACTLSVNSIAYRVYGRNSGTKLGANARDEPANISTLVTASESARHAWQMDRWSHLSVVT